MTTATSDTSDFKPGLEGVIAFETEIAEPDKEGGALRYRGVDIEDLVGQVSFGNVWGLLVDNEFNPGPAAGRAVPAPGALRRRPGRRAERAGDAGPGVGLPPAARHRRDRDPRRPRPRLGDGAVVRRAVGPRHRPADGPAARGRQGRDHRRAVHDPLARRARPAARAGRRRLLDVGRRARHERLDVHRPGHRLDRRRRRGLPVRRGRRDVRPAARRRPVAGAAHARRRRGDRRRRRPTSRACSTAASG